MTKPDQVRFWEEVVRHGVREIKDLKERYPLGTAISDEKMELWLRQLRRTPAPPLFEKIPRLINRFRLGADPEFIFEDVERRRRVDATSFGLHTGLAFGCDQNGRLVELRPRPYRSALRVTASVLQSLRWLALMKPAALRYSWRAGAFLYDDGIGGHVHFGRKRPERERETDALAHVMIQLAGIGTFPIAQCERRLAGDARGQMYGRLDDIRNQAYGYEYRAFPSWLDSPWTAFFSLTLAKLAVQDPGLVCAWPVDAAHPELLTDLLSYYKGRDDDAALALVAVKRHGLPRHVGGDFRPRWGLTYENPKTSVEVVPDVIPAGKKAPKELYEFLVNGTPITAAMPELTWSPDRVPEGYVRVIDIYTLNRAKGMCEMLWDVVTPTEMMTSVLPGENGFEVDRELAAMLDPEWTKAAQSLGCSVRVYGAGSYAVRLAPVLREPEKARQTKELLLSGLFPLWSLKTVTRDSWRDWLSERKRTKNTPGRFRGAILVDG